MTDRLIVYPDANRQLGEIMAGPQLQRLQAIGEVQIHYGAAEDESQFKARIGEANGLLLGWGLPVEVMRAAPNLEIISFVGIGAGNFVDLSEAIRLGITVCNTPGYADNTVAEHALAMMLAVARHVSRLDRDLRRGQWNQSLAGIELKGKRLGLIGFGGIGARLAEQAQGIGMRVRAWTRNPNRERSERHAIEFASLEDILHESDVLSVHVALTPDTEGLINAEALAHTRPGVIIVNTARGEVIDEQALIGALRSGHVAAAALDVYRQEPLPADHPLLELDNVLLTPHVAYNTPEASVKLLDIAIDNILRYYQHAPINVVAAPEPRA